MALCEFRGVKGFYVQSPQGFISQALKALNPTLGLCAGHRAARGAHRKAALPRYVACCWRAGLLLQGLGFKFQILGLRAHLLLPCTCSLSSLNLSLRMFWKRNRYRDGYLRV